MFCYTVSLRKLHNFEPWHRLAVIYYRVWSWKYMYFFIYSWRHYIGFYFFLMFSFFSDVLLNARTRVANIRSLKIVAPRMKRPIMLMVHIRKDEERCRQWIRLNVFHLKQKAGTQYLHMAFYIVIIETFINQPDTTVKARIFQQRFILLIGCLYVHIEWNWLYYHRCISVSQLSSSYWEKQKRIYHEQNNLKWPVFIYETSDSL